MRLMKASEYWHHFSSSSERTGIVTSSTFSGFAAFLRVHEAAVERHVLDPLGARFRIDDLREEMRVAPFGVHVGDREEAVEIVEADVLRLGGRVLADVPLADGLRDVAGLGEQLRQRDLALQAAWLAVHRRAVQAVAVGHAAGQQRGARRRAAGLGVAGRQLQAVARDPVEVRRRRADGDAAAVAAEVAPTDIVHEEDQDIGPLAAARDKIRDLFSGSFGLCGVRKCRLQVFGDADRGRCDGIECGHGVSLSGKTRRNDVELQREIVQHIE